MKRDVRTQRGPLAMRIAFIVCVSISQLLLLPAPSPAIGLAGDSTTYLQSRETTDKTKILGAYEYLDFGVQDIGSETVTFHFGGWLRYDLKGEEFGKKSNSDLQYSYLSFKSKTDNTIVNLGRVMVFEGVAAERVDGMYARTDLKGGFGVSAFGGSPVETGIDEPGNNVIYGARVYHQIPDVYRLGVSALKDEKNSSDYRKETGIDLWVHPVSKVDITGRSSYNDITKGWMEHTYVLSLGPFEKLRLDTTASWIRYDDYFFRATTSAFSLRAGILEPHEKVRILGEEASYPLTDTVRLVADYRNYGYDIEGNADYYGGKLLYASGSGGAGASLHRMAGDTDKLRYSEYRVYGYKKFGKTDLAVDLLDVSYDSAISGVKDAYSASLAAQYDITEAWKVGADVEYSHNPDFDNEVIAFAKLIYTFSTVPGAGGGR